MARRRQRSRRSRLVFRIALAVGVCVVALLYYKPARTYLHTRNAVSAREAEVRKLERQHRQLERLVAESTSDEALARQARRLGLVKPGERLFIVKGIKRWLRAHARGTVGVRER